MRADVTRLYMRRRFNHLHDFTVNVIKISLFRVRYLIIIILVRKFYKLIDIPSEKYFKDNADAATAKRKCRKQKNGDAFSVTCSQLQVLSLPNNRREYRNNVSMKPLFTPNYTLNITRWYVSSSPAKSDVAVSAATGRLLLAIYGCWTESWQHRRPSQRDIPPTRARAKFSRTRNGGRKQFAQIKNVTIFRCLQSKRINCIKEESF